MYINQCFKKDGTKIHIKQIFDQTDFPKLKELLKKNRVGNEDQESKISA